MLTVAAASPDQLLSILSPCHVECLKIAKEGYKQAIFLLITIAGGLMHKTDGMREITILSKVIII